MTKRTAQNLPSIYNLIHCQEEPLHILQQSPPLNIFSKEHNKMHINFLDIRRMICKQKLFRINSSCQKHTSTSDWVNQKGNLELP